MKRSGLLHRALRTALVVALGAGCLVGGFRVAAGCWIGRDCGVVSESASVPQTVLLSRDELTVTVEGPRPCSGGFHLTATEQSDRVVLSGVVTSPRRPVACHGAMMNASWPVHLRTPLGDRPPDPLGRWPYCAGTELPADGVQAPRRQARRGPRH